MKQLLSLLLAAALLFGAAPAVYADGGVGVIIGGVPVQWTDAEPFIDENGRTLVPLRAVGDALGLEVGWDGAAQTASFSGGGRTIWFLIGSTVAIASDAGPISMDTAAVIISGRTYSPIRYLAEFFGYAVGWDGASRTVILTAAGQTAPLVPEEPQQPAGTPGSAAGDEVRTVHYEWDWQGWSWSYDLDIPVAAVTAYKSIPRDPYSYLTGYSSYVSEPSDDEYLSQLAEKFLDAAAENGWGEDAAVRLAIAFVQSLKYTPDDIGLGYDYPKYPLETLYDQGGDCEDSSILLVSLIRAMGYGCCLVMFDDHMGVGVLGDDSVHGSYFQYSGRKYFYVETTAEGWEIGQMPPELTYKTATIWAF